VEISGISANDSDSRSEVILELQLEVDSLKRQYGMLVAKHEKERRDLEISAKTLSDEKKKIENQLSDLLSDRGDSLNTGLLKKISELENNQGVILRENKELKEKLEKTTGESREEVETLRNLCDMLKKKNETQKEKIVELTQHNSELIHRNSDEYNTDEKFAFNKDKNKKKSTQPKIEKKAQKIKQLKRLNKRIAEENKKIKKSESEISEKLKKNVQKTFDKIKDEANTGKIDSALAKELGEENKRLKKSEGEIRAKYEKLLKSQEDKGLKLKAKKNLKRPHFE